jgi:hypothetical protein
MKTRWGLMIGLALLLALALVPAMQVAAAGCPAGPAQRLAAGDVARPAQVYSSLRSGFESNTILVTMYRSRGDQFRVVSGPRCGFYHVWYQVDYNGRIGWVTEGEGSTYWVERVTGAPPPPPPPPPPQVCGPAPRLVVNGNARPAQVYSSLRAGIGSADVLRVLYRRNGDVVRVLEGPICRGAHYWGLMLVEKGEKGVSRRVS